MQRGQVPRGHERIGAEQLVVQRVVLRALHHAVTVAVPAARNPAELHARARLWPQPGQPCRVAAELPVAVQLEHAGHLAVRRRERVVAGTRQRQVHPEVHQAVVIGGVQELHLAHPLRQLQEQRRGGVLVAPYVVARPHAAALVREAALEPVEGAVLGTEADLRAQRADVEQGGLLDHVRQIALAQRPHERHGVLLQPREIGEGAFHHLPGVVVAGGVVVAHPGPARAGGVAAAGEGRFGEAADRAPGHAVGEVPADHEAHRRRAVRGQRQRHRQRGVRRRPHAGVPRFQPAVRAEVLPEVAQRPRGRFVQPGGAPGQLTGGVGGQGDGSGLLGRGIHPRGGEQHAAQRRSALTLPILVAIAGRCAEGAVVADDIGDGAAHRGAQRSCRGVGQYEAQDGGRDAARRDVARDQRVETLHHGSDRQVRVGKLHLAERVGGRETARAKARQPVVGLAAALLAGDVVGLVDRPLQGARAALPAGLLGVHGKEGIRRRKALGGTVHHLPVAQVAPSAEGDGAGSDPPERQRDHAQMVLVVPSQHRPWRLLLLRMHLPKARLGLRPPSVKPSL